MAKSKKAADATDRGSKDSGSKNSGMEQKVLEFAEQLGWMVGTVQAKSEGWLDREALSAQVSRIRDSAAELVTHLGAQGLPGLQGLTGSRGAAGAQGSRGSGARGSKGAVKAPLAEKAKTKTAGGSRKQSTAAANHGRGPVDAPGKRHREPPPSAHGIKKSDLRIPKEALARSMRQRGGPRG